MSEHTAVAGWPPYGEPTAPVPPPGQPPRRPGRARGLIIAAAAALAVLGGTIGAAATGAGHTIAGSAVPAVAAPVRPGTTASTTATADQQVGVVDINTDLKYDNAQAAGTGMILTSAGEVLTNNHVIEGATTIKATVVSTGKTYDATVKGTDSTDDVAVIQLTGASDLATVTTGQSSAVAAGDPVVAVGNAGGVGGAPHAARGTVVAVGQTITASDEAGRSEQLTDMIEINSAIKPGDSGGPLYNADTKVIGMDTAASATSRRSNTTDAYAIPIDRALSVVAQIDSGQDSATVHIGESAFLGVQVQTAEGASGAVVASTIPDGPAAQAGIVAGDVITTVDGRAVDSTSLSTVMQGYHPGDRVALTWSDTSGREHTGTLTLTAGPPR